MKHFDIKTQIYFGENALDRLASLPYHNALFIADPFVVSSGLIHQLTVRLQQAGIPLEDACRMASETPAKIMKVYDRKGSLEADKDADIIMLDPNLELTYVMQMGHEVVNKLA